MQNTVCTLVDFGVKDENWLHLTFLWERGSVINEHACIYCQNCGIRCCVAYIKLNKPDGEWFYSARIIRCDYYVLKYGEGSQAQNTTLCFDCVNHNKIVIKI